MPDVRRATPDVDIGKMHSESGFTVEGFRQNDIILTVCRGRTRSGKQNY